MLPTNRRLRQAAAALACTLALAAASLAATPAGAAPHGASISCTTGSATLNYVNYVYTAILDRCPDTAGNRYWSDQLEQGLDRWSFVEAIDMSEENVVKNNVDQIFDELLNRAPSATELAQWSASIREHHADALMIATLGSSDEFWNNLSGSTPAQKDEAWLTSAYHGILDRDPDTGGHDYYLAQLGTPSTAASRFDVAVQLEYSAENAADWTGAVYYAGLNRPADSAGFQYWLGWLTGPGNWQTFRMWTHILASDEAFSLAQSLASTGLPAPRTYHSFR